MQLAEFKDHKTYLARKYSLAKKDKNRNPVRMREIHWLNYGWGEENDPTTGEEKMEHHPDKDWIRYTLSKTEPWKKVKLTIHDTHQDAPPTLNTSTLPLNAKKVKDLQTLAKKYIPEPQKSFYMNLKATDNDDDDGEQ